MIADLIKIFSNRTRSLEVLYLMEGLKKAVRLDANRGEIEKIREFCDGRNLFLEVSDFKVIKSMDEGKGGFSNLARRVPLNDPNPGLCHLYISRDKNKSKFLKILENKNDDKAVGELLGYPKCCIDFFLANRENQKKIQNDYILPALNNSKGFEFSFLSNHAARYFDYALLSHFPCSFECKESMKIAKQNLECVEKESKQLAREFEETLKGAFLYTETQGVFKLEEFKLTGSRLKFKKTRSTANRELAQTLNQKKEVEIIDKNRVKIDEKKLEGIGLMIFT